MDNVHIVGIDLAKRSFQLHGAGADHLSPLFPTLSNKSYLGEPTGEVYCGLITPILIGYSKLSSFFNFRFILRLYFFQ